MRIFGINKYNKPGYIEGPLRTKMAGRSKNKIMAPMPVLDQSPEAKAVRSKACMEEIIRESREKKNR